MDTPRMRLLKKRILNQRKKIRRLQYHNRRLNKKVALLIEILDSLTEKSLINEEDRFVLERVGGKTEEMFKRMVLKSKTGKDSRSQYSPELRTFALTLHFYSARAFKYVRKTFVTCLPAPRTLTRWFSSIDGKPGFTNEALKAIKARVTGKKVYAALIIDEMKIMESEEYHRNSGRTFGFVDFGFGVDLDCEDKATEVLVFLLVALNEVWKVPIAYFASAGVNAEQKSTLILTAIQLVQATGVEVKAITFDGPRTHLATAKKLGCDLDTDKLKIFFENPANGNKIYLFFDPCHMLKNVRNAFEAYGTLEDIHGKKIKWQFLEDLHKLQDDELFHLANKLRANHVYFKTRIINVRLASQLFSNSVADALLFCETELHIVNFCEVQATAEFLRLINNMFDVLDSRIHQYGYKRALNIENYKDTAEVLDQGVEFLRTLKWNGKLVLKTPRFTGFLGFCVCAESAKGLFHDLIKTESENRMTYLPLHKVSQDHIEFSFSNVRSYGRCSDNPTIRQFESIYKKMLVHMELIDVDSGNCIPLEKNSILNCSSSIDKINKTTARINSNPNLPSKEDDDNILDTTRVTTLSPFGNKVVQYIAGFVVHKLLKTVKCDTCVTPLLSSKTADVSSVIAQKDNGKLIYPSSDVINICRCCEEELRKGIDQKKLKKEYTTNYILSKVSSKLVNLQLFQDIQFHSYENDYVNHITELTKAVAENYLNTRITYVRKNLI